MMRTLAVLLAWSLGMAAPAGNPAPAAWPLPDLAGHAPVEPAAVVCFLEGPAVHADGSVYFSDIAGNRILHMDPAGKVSVFRADSGRTNGNTFDAQGRLISCEGNEQGVGRRRVVRTDLETGKVEVLADRYRGKRFNSPNDACVDARGRVWFTDPYYGPDLKSLEMDVQGVYRIDGPGKIVRVLDNTVVHRPNGLALTPDGKTLYVVDSHPKIGGNRKIWAFPVAEDGSVGKPRLIHDFKKGRGGDGMRLDVQGNLWVAAGISYKRSPGEDTSVPPGVYVFSPQGKPLGRIPIGEDLITNVAFGGPDGKMLYVTAGKTLYRLPVRVAGYNLYPPRK